MAGVGYVALDLLAAVRDVLSGPPPRDGGGVPGRSSQYRRQRRPRTHVAGRRLPGQRGAPQRGLPPPFPLCSLLPGLVSCPRPWSGAWKTCTAHPLTALPVVPRAIWHTVCPRSLSADGKDVPVEGGFAGHRLARTFVPTLNVAVWCACAAGAPRPVRSAVRRNHHVSFGAPVCRSACLPAQSFNPSDLRVSPTLLSPTNPSKHAWRPSPSLGRTVPTAHQ